MKTLQVNQIMRETEKNLLTEAIRSLESARAYLRHAYKICEENGFDEDCVEINESSDYPTNSLAEIPDQVEKITNQIGILNKKYYNL